MRKIFLILFLSFFPTVSAGADTHLTDLVKKVQPAVVKIVVYDMNNEISGIGSGFFVDNDGHLITNYHVLQGAFSADVIAHDGGKYPIDFVVAQHRRSDLLKVKVNIPEMLIQWLGITDKVPSIAEQVLVVGSPLGLEQSVSEGIVSAIRELPNFGKFFQTTAPISPGSSGSPVVNMEGDVVGVISFQSTFGQNLNFAIAGKNVLELDNMTANKTLAEWTYSVSNQKQKLAEDLCRKGFSFAINGEYKKALTFYRDATKEDPKDINTWYGLSQCYIGLGQHDEAIDTYQEAIRIHTKDSILYYNLGNYYNRLGEHNEAIGAYKEALRLDPNAAGIYDRLGLTYSKLGIYKKAIDAYKNAIRINPAAASSHYHIGVAHGKRGNFQSAIRAYKVAVNLNPDYGQVFNNMGIAYGKLGKQKNVLEAFKHVIRIDPDNAFAHYEMGLAYAALGDRRSALQEYKILRELDAETADKLFDRIY